MGSPSTGLRMSRRSDRGRRRARRARGNGRQRPDGLAEPVNSTAPVSRYLQIIGTARLRNGERPFAAVVWGPLVTLDQEGSPCEDLRLKTEAALAAVASKQRQN
jgi:hypothetical protein